MGTYEQGVPIQVIMLTNGTEHDLNVMVVWLLEFHSSLGLTLVTLLVDMVNLKIL